MPIVRSMSASDGRKPSLAELASGAIRQASDGWHAVLRIRDGAPPLAERGAAAECLMQPNCRSMQILRSARMPHIGCGAPSTVVRQDLPSISFRHSGANGWRWRCERSTADRWRHLSRDRRGPVRPQTHSRTRLEDPRSAQPHHPPGANRLRPDAWRLSRLAAPAARKK